MNSDNDFIKDITPYVLKTLENKKFFEALDDQMCPKEPMSGRVLCEGTLSTSTSTLSGCGFDEQEIEEVLAVLAAGGGCCDCEVLYNVAEESRLKSEYWKAVTSKRRPLHGHGGAVARQKKTTDWLRLWIQVEKDEEGFPDFQDWEDLWAQPTSAGPLIIESVPFYAKGIARRDQVKAVVSTEGFLAVDKITERGGHSTFRILLHEDSAGSADEVVTDLEGMGAVVEVTLESLLAIDVDTERESKIWDYLQEGKESSRWGLQVGHSPD